MSEGSELRITLDLHPLGTVQMEGLLVRVEAAGREKTPGHVFGVKLIWMSDRDRWARPCQAASGG